jgi:hypothetical protein
MKESIIRDFYFTFYEKIDNILTIKGNYKDNINSFIVKIMENAYDCNSIDEGFIIVPINNNKFFSIEVTIDRFNPLYTERVYFEENFITYFPHIIYCVMNGMISTIL